MNEKKSQILIVDDDRGNINVLGTMLADCYEIIVAMNGEQALQLIASNPEIDLVLLDINMPGIDGFEVCKQIKQNPDSQDIPVIFITANSNEESEKKGLLIGAVDYITKPFSQPIVQLRVKIQLELKSQRDLLAYISRTDGLTKIANRRSFDEFLEKEWLRSLREKNNLSLIMIDIDFFKQFNDLYGHTEGDACLQKVAKTIKNSLERPADLASRYGGEEFACILPSTQLAGASYIAETIRKNIVDLKIPHRLSLVESFVTVSIGVSSTIPEQLGNSLSLVKIADKMLYFAKENGRNRVVS